MAEKNIVPFHFGNQAVRSVGINGEPWFVAKDIVEAVDAVWKGTSGSIAHIPEEWRGVHSVQTPSGMQEMAVLSEQGVYFYLSRSDKPAALPIQMWIAGEVLPSIRKTGAYSVKQTPVQRIDAIQAMLDEIRETEARVTKLEGAVENFGAHEDYRSIKAHAAFLGIKGLTDKQAGALGKRATALSNQRGIAVGKQPDSNYFKVNTYHRDILEEVFKALPDQGK